VIARTSEAAYPIGGAALSVPFQERSSPILPGKMTGNAAGRPYSYLVQAAVEATLGKRLDVAVAAEKDERHLLISGEELSGDCGNGHDLSRGELGLAVVSVVGGLEQFIEEAVEGYNLLRHGRLLARVV